MRLGTGFLIKDDIVMTSASICFDEKHQMKRGGLEFEIDGKQGKKISYNVKETYFP